MAAAPKTPLKFEVFLVLGILEFPKIRHCEALKKEGTISFIKP